MESSSAASCGKASTTRRALLPLNVETWLACDNVTQQVTTNHHDQGDASPRFGIYRRLRRSRQWNRAALNVDVAVPVFSGSVDRGTSPERPA
jgi:hypothetical protein